jgi:ubiquinone/menaquinone biosynthesis C-methylase UbiE
MAHKLYEQFAKRYDIHTPPSQYRHDHAFVIKECLSLGPNPSLLDVGCGTGVLIQKACEKGINAFGIDPATAMIEVCRSKFDGSRVRQCGVEDLDDKAIFDCITSLSWSLNYSSTIEELATALHRLNGVLRPGGLIILEVPNAAAARGKLVKEYKPGPSGLAEDVLFIFRFQAQTNTVPQLSAQYVYACSSLNELLYEEHILNVADPQLVCNLLAAEGFKDIVVYDSWRKEPFAASISPFIVARKPRL